MKSKISACVLALALLGGGGSFVSVPAAAAPGKCHSFWTDLKQQRVKPATKCKDVNLLEVRAKRVKTTTYWAQFKVGDRWRDADARLRLSNGKVGTKIIIRSVRPGTVYQIRAKNGAMVRVLH